MEHAFRSAAVRALAVCTTLAALAGCNRSEPPATDFKDNVERTVGAPQESQGMFGGNSGPSDAGAGALGDASCSPARACGAAPGAAADAGS